MITLLIRKQVYEFPAPLSVKEALERLGLTPETHLVLREGILLEQEDQLRDGDVVKLIASISGGNQVE